MKNTSFADTASTVQETDNKDWKSRNTELQPQEQIEGTPFVITTIDGENFITMGDYKLSERGTKEELKKLIKQKDWNLIMATIGAVVSVAERVRILKTETIKTEI